MHILMASPAKSSSEKYLPSFLGRIKQQQQQEKTKEVRRENDILTFTREWAARKELRIRPEDQREKREVKLLWNMVPFYRKV